MERRPLHQPRVAPLWGELRYSLELAQLLAAEGLRPPRRAADGPAVLLIPGFMAGDGSLTVLRRWLQRRGHPVSMSGIRVSVGCTERIVSRLEAQLEQLAHDSGRKVVLIGQSRGGAMARCLAVRKPAATDSLVMLGAPVRDPLAVSPHVRRTASVLLWLGDRGLPLISTDCRDGDCCAAIWDQIAAPLAPHIRAVSVYSRSDGIVDWRACLDPHAQAVEVVSSHCGMSVHARVFELLARVLDGEPARARARRSASAPHKRPRRSAAQALG